MNKEKLRDILREVKSDREYLDKNKYLGTRFDRYFIEILEAILKDEK